MKRMTLAVMLLALTGLSATAQAQSPLGRLREKVKEKTSTQPSQPSQPSSTPASTGGNTNQPASGGAKQEPGRNPDGTMKTAAQSGGDSKYPPGILFSSLLVGTVLLHNGEMTFENVAATFLPPSSSVKQSDLPYNWIDGGRLESVIRTADGKPVKELRWQARPTNGPYWRLVSHYPTGRFKMSPGDYVMDFSVEGRTFYRFPFSIVREGGGDDPFAAGAGDKLLLKGAWNDFGYIHLVNGSPSSNFHFKTWLRVPVKKFTPVAVELLRDGKKIAENVGEQNLGTNWVRYDFEMRKPGGSQIQGSEVLGTDGKYKLVVRVDGKPYGSYPFTVQGGKIQYHPRQRRGEVDPMTFIEGGNDAWFVEREK